MHDAVRGVPALLGRRYGACGQPLRVGDGGKSLRLDGALPQDGWVDDEPGSAGGDDVPSPSVVAVWMVLGRVPSELVPRWAAHWLAMGYDGPALLELACLYGDDPHGVRDLLPGALADCGASVPSREAAAAADEFRRLAVLHLTGRAAARWVLEKVVEIVVGCEYSVAVLSEPLGRLYLLDDDWGVDGGSTDAQWITAVREACLAQTRTAGTGSASEPG